MKWIVGTLGPIGFVLWGVQKTPQLHGVDLLMLWVAVLSVVVMLIEHNFGDQ